MSQVTWVCIDSTDPESLAPFWASALGYGVLERQPDSNYLYLETPDESSPVFYFQQVPEPKTTKNRLHLDLRTTAPAELIERLEGLGATRIGERHGGKTCDWWQVLADPQGNEFCVCATTSPDDATAAGDVVALMPFSQLLGVRLEEATSARVVGTLAWAPERCTAGGLMHGGALMSLADSLGGLSAFLNLPDGASTSTIESKTNFFRPVSRGLVRGTTTPVHIGRSTVVLETRLRDDDGRAVALVIQTQSVLRPEPR